MRPPGGSAWNIAAVVALAAAAVSARAQGASLRIAHDHPTGEVMPGESVRLQVRVDWAPSSAILLHVAGDVLATPDIGAASNAQIAIPFPGGVIPPPGPAHFWNPGTPSGGSLLGVEIVTGMYHNPFGNPIPPPWNINTNFPLVAFDWVAPNAPGATINFTWHSSVAVPNPIFNFNHAHGPLGTLPTTYIGTTLTVIPAPAGAAPLLLIGGGILARRRRR